MSANIKSDSHGGWMRGSVGILSLLFSIGLLYKNELYDNVTRMIVDVGFNRLPDSANDRKLIYLKGHIEVNEPLTEPEYGVTIAAVKLKRRVQMYQWVEVQEEQSFWWGVDVETHSTTSYITAWRDKLVDSTMFVKSFGHANPKTFPVESSVSVSEIVRVGNYILSDELKEHFNTYILLTSDQRPERRDIKMHSGLYYHSFDVWNPEVGDTRVQLSYAGASDSLVTILAQQAGSTLQPFYIDGKDLTTVMEGERPLSDILDVKFPSSGVWLIRIPACFAIYCAYSSLSFIAGKRSRLLQAFVNNNKALLCQILSAATLFAVMGIAWFSYSPLIGSVNLFGSSILILYTFSKGYSLYYYFNR